MQTRDPIDDLLVRAIAAVDALGRGVHDGVPVMHFAVLGAACDVDRPDAAVDATVEQLLAHVPRSSTGGAAFERLYLAICAPPADEAAESRIAAWRQAVVRRCRHGASYEFRVPEHADAQALWHAVDAGGALVATYVPASGTLAVLAIGRSRDDAPYAATIERSTVGRVAGASHESERRDVLSLALADAVRDSHDDSATSTDWTSRDRCWRCTVRRGASDGAIVASDPMATALALLQRVSGYPVRDALASGDAHMTLAVDSIMALEYAERFRAAFGRRLPVDALLDRPPLHAVVERIRACLRDAGNDDAFVPLGRRRAAEGVL